MTNAGLGSNLTMHGRVECDAAIVDGVTGAIGAVGAAPGIKNPVKAAHVLLKQDRDNNLPLGLVPPMYATATGRCH